MANPPFAGDIKQSDMLAPYELAHKRAKDGGQGKLESAVGRDLLFIERNLDFLRPGGRMAIVLPDGLLQNISNGSIRFWIRSKANVLGVVSIPQEAFIPYGTGIKTSLLLLQKRPAAPQTHCFMARIEKIGYDVKRTFQMKYFFKID